MKPGKTGVARLIAATRYSLRGLRACWKTEAAFRQDVALSVILVPVAFFVARTPEQWLLLTAPLLLLLIVELLNSAVETVVDRIGTEHNELSGRAKDIGSAAVFLCLLLIAMAWLTIVWRNFFA
ncbi:diacylglycerol kinase [Elongatibacter sediminis]|uniref:Diacylglycerol kinase n=1 Tax=Elongatibacter sediminis TaxID=3119006 RepID=A0AAW9R5U0_9GAMM